ncbi:MAG: flagellin [Lachnospiraceae bacterium]|nr:flagellin [Lachnospiraceae bacterium]
MAMIVQHNLTAMNSNRQLGITTGSQAKSSEKLSSGYRINRAGDDAAGLKISEKMRSQVRGLNRASTNAQDGVSLIQTAEGALNEAHSILQRMNELAVQGANDTNESIDRDAINEELDQLTQELDRISTTTQFNKQNLLDGTFQDKNLHVGANTNQKITIGIDNMNAETLGLRAIKGEEKSPVQKGEKPTQISYKGTDYTYDTSLTLSANQAAAISAFQAAVSGTANADDYATQFNKSTGSVYYIDSEENEYDTAASAMAADISIAKAAVSDAIMNSIATYLKTEATTGADTPVGASSTAFTLAKPNVGSYAKANATIQAVQEAINKVSSQRSALGAIQNRLEHTIANLDNVAENTQAAESRIRDLDMAAEMVEYSKNNILAQAGQSMLAQANQATQGVLSLLQ